MKSLSPPTILLGVLLLALAIEGTGSPEPVKVHAYWALQGSNPPAPCNPYALTRDDDRTDSASLLYVIRREYRTPGEISHATGIPQPAVERKLRDLRKCALVREKAGRFLVDFPFWDQTLRDQINVLGLDLASQVAGVIESELPGLRDVFGRTSLPSKGFAWDEASLVVVGGLLLDTGLNDRGLRIWQAFDPERDTPIRPGNHRYWYRAVEGGWGPYWKFGHDLSHNGSHDLWFGMFYGSKKGHRTVKSESWDVHDERTLSILFPLIREGSATIETLLRQTGLSEEELRRRLDAMAEEQVVRVEGHEILPAFPVFQEKDLGILFTEIDRIAAGIIREVYVPFQSRIEERWKAIKPESWEMAGIDKFIHREVFSRAYNLTLDLLIEKGALPPPPVKAPFACWGIKGHHKVV